jgi:C4-dicarboxylate-specific signal transduction histidine kinase
MDGDYRWLHTLGFPLRDGEGRIVVWYILSIDVTDRKRSEEKLRQVRSELAHMARVSSLGVLTASIAHEINQPLSGIVANAGTSLKMLAAEPPKVSGAQQTTQRIVRDVNRAADIVKRLRALFVKRDATREAVDLNDASREVVALFSSDLQRKQVVVNSEFAEELPGVTGDRVQLQQVILNLLMNAADAMRSIEGRPRQVMIRTEREDTNRVRLTVRDAGIGLEPQVAERLFEAFFTTKTEGMGIGLSISRTIIDNHGGRIWAEPNDGPGVTFAFSIPCDFQDASSVHVSPHDAGGPSCGLSDGKS